MNNMKIKFRYFWGFILLGISSIVTGQNVFENDSLKYWQPETKITWDDFKSDTVGFMNLNSKYNMKAYSFCYLKSILDVPKKKRERGKKLEKIYFAPCLVKHKSVSITTDSLELAKQKVYLDITELFARKARMRLEALRDTIGNAYGVYWMSYSKIVSKICKERNEMYAGYTNDVFLLKIEGHYEKWRDYINQQLSQTEKYATKPEDCLRFLTGKPLSEDYIMSPDYLGEINCN